MQAFRFTPEIELALFKEVINVVPYNYGGKEAKEAWKEVDSKCNIGLWFDPEDASEDSKDQS